MGQSGKVLRGVLKKAESSGGGDDVKRQVDNQDGKQKPIYELVNVKTGGGKLVDLIKLSAKISSGSSFNSNTTTTDTEIDSGRTFTRTNQTTSSSLDDQMKHVDRDIEALVLPFLYNEGRGKLVPLRKIWEIRFGKEYDEQNFVEESVEFNREDDTETGPNVIKKNKVPEKSQWVCWRLNERGFVGETALHICFLLSTPTHMILAKKLLNLFPMLINDIYTCDEYFGESALHMAIVNEDVRMVKLLLDYGANVHERCLGVCWMPDDQKPETNTVLKKIILNKDNHFGQPNGSHNSSPGVEMSPDLLDLSSNQLSNGSVTNYDGYLYWGEYALSFAACLGLQDCYKLLLAKGANPNRQDTNGNTTLHMTVIADRRDMFDLCYSNGAKLSILNKQNLTPLQLAAKLRRVEIFFHILSIQRQVNWIFCNVGFVEIPLKGLDSINEIDGSCDPNSVLSIVVSGGSNEHLQMFDGFLSQLLQTKWECVVREKFYWWLCQFLLFLFVASLAYIKRFNINNSLPVKTSNNFQLIMINSSSKSTVSASDGLQFEPTERHHHLPYDNAEMFFQDWLRFALDQITTLHINYSEYLLILFVIYYVWLTLIRLFQSSSSFKSFLDSIQEVPEMSLFTLTCLLILICVPLRLLEWQLFEDVVASLIMFMLPLKLLFFCRASLDVGSFVVMIYKILVNDVICFFVFLVIFVAGFSQSFLIMFKSYDASQTIGGSPAQAEEMHFKNLFDGIISMHMMALNEFGIVFDQFQGTNYNRLAKFMFIIYMILVSILLINMLIAMLGKTYQDIASQPNESLRQWARALLRIERMWTNEHRLRVLNRYSRPASYLPSASNHLASNPLTSTVDDCLDVSGAGHHLTTRSQHVSSGDSPMGGPTMLAASKASRFYGTTWPLTQLDRKKIEVWRKLREENARNLARLARLESIS